MPSPAAVRRNTAWLKSSPVGRWVSLCGEAQNGFEKFKLASSAPNTPSQNSRSTCTHAPSSGTFCNLPVQQPCPQLTEAKLPDLNTYK